ncbi:MAG: sensor histidine kinase [Pirellulaceae bacterium]
MFERRSMKWPILLAVAMIILLLGLAVGWVLLNVTNAMGNPSSPGLYWVLLSAGSAMFICVVAGVVLYLIWSIQQINLNRRQSNFIDSVTHELKSPIASLKLYLQTLNRRPVDQTQRMTFYRSMLDDVDRLEQLIDQLLEAARLEHATSRSEMATPMRIDELLEEIAREVAKRHRVSHETIRLRLAPIEGEVRKGEFTVLFRNLIDNAIKYAGNPPSVQIDLEPDQKHSWAKISISDNGQGIPRAMRRMIFGRFIRVGNELERTKPGTGLGLFLVRSLVRQMRGTIRLADLPQGTGTRFEVSLPDMQGVGDRQAFYREISIPKANLADQLPEVHEAGGVESMGSEPA